MNNTPPTPNVANTPVSAPKDRSAAVLIATGFGLGLVPRVPGTAGSLGAVAVFAPLLLGLENPFVQLGYVILLVTVALAALWAAEQALPHWGTSDPQAVVVDEILGQFLAYGGLVLAAALGRPPGSLRAAGLLLLIGFVLFRLFDVAKPYPIRQSERLPGASGVLMDDTLAGVYAGLILTLLAWSGWLN
ncbi:MAG: phosphatidylglycerophosphatase A family protein [Candidatus Acidiferrales bacterium]